MAKLKKNATKQRKLYIVSLEKCMMSVKDIVGSLLTTILPHLGDIMPSGGGLSGRVFFQRGYLA